MDEATSVDDIAQLRVALNQVLNELPRDELRTLLRHAKRLRSGLDAYGALDIQRSKRDWLLELQAELDDAQHYIQWELERDSSKK